VSTDWLDKAIDDSKRQTRTDFMRYRRASRKWEPAPMPEGFARDGTPVWLDRGTPVVLTRHKYFDPML